MLGEFMTYLYEQLSPEKFQQLCQSVLISQFPNVQCLPVGQPDGGRDAFEWIIPTLPGHKQEFTVFQVKFSRQPDTSKNFLKEITDLELPKIAQLKERGAKAYYLITNNRGTSHLDGGTIDQLNQKLSATLAMPAYCWWRDDLDRRIDTNSDIKWSFPEIIRGSDLLQSLLEGTVREDGQRRDDAIRAYLAAQYRDDREVKFKQVDLYNSLLDLFVDTNLGPSEATDSPRAARRFVQQSNQQFGRFGFGEDGEESAEFLLRSNQTSHRIVLEGAPGQGKSTITQYICQVHRLRLLGKSDDLRTIKPFHLEGTARLPLRVDLRDYAGWLAGKNPFAAEMGTPRPSDMPSSLEGFLSFQISELSGGHQFSVSDLAAVARKSHLLIVLDGFDEVADVETRKLIVKEISKACARLETTTRSIQAIVTSRPAAFAKSPGFPQGEWVHLTLHSMTIEQINEYAEKWMTARQLPFSEQEKFRQVLKEKLEQAHMRDLARNPMQLAILLNLIQTRGLSLPDKRTALYDSYMELFFSREAEKSTIVREHRDLLVELHRYLAWIIQTEAEEVRSQGSITEERLRLLLRTYLATEGYATDLVDELFTGMVERVVALVSRVQGTFEFEVQPLREYFAARHLYETAPYSPPGRERSGTKPERFDALARNFYWLNVTRFYCGCYSRGELSSLVDGLLDLSESSEMKSISYPRLLVSMLLSDWVFTQQPHLVKRITALLLENPGFRIALANLDQNRSASFIPPERSGRDYVLSKCMERLVDRDCRSDELFAIARLMRNDLNSSELRKIWGDLRSSTLEFKAWLKLGRMLGVLSNSSASELTEFLTIDKTSTVREFAFSNRHELIDQNAEALDVAVKLILESKGGFLSDHSTTRSSNILTFGSALELGSYAMVLRADGPTGLESMIEGGAPFSSIFDSIYPWQFPDPPGGRPLNEAQEHVMRFLEVHAEVSNIAALTWRDSLEPWTRLVEAGIREFGMRPALTDIALLSGGVASRHEKGSYGTDIADASVPLCERIRFARLRSGAPQWWDEQFKRCSDINYRYLLLTTFLYWATPRTILHLAPLVEKELETLSPSKWSRLVDRLRRTTTPSSSSINLSDASKIRSDRLMAVLSLRIPAEMGNELLATKLIRYKKDDPNILEMVVHSLIQRTSEDEKAWRAALSLIKRGYEAGVRFDRSSRRGRSQLKALSVKAAGEICNSASEYPLWLVNAAQQKLTETIGESVRPPGAIAREDNWFVAY
jgi:hypothetical protein